MVDLRRERRMRSRILVLLLLAGPASSAGPHPVRAECSIATGEPAIVAAVSGAATLTLESGETLVLSGLMPPEAGPIPDENWPPRVAAQTELEHLVAGKSVLIAPAPHATNRYGNRLGQVYLTAASGADPVWVQGELIAAGLARATAIEADEPCLADMLALEGAARADKRGNWGTGLFADRDAGELFTLRRLHDTFQTLVGTVQSIDHGHGPPALMLRSAASPNAHVVRGSDVGFRVEMPDIKGQQYRAARSEILAGIIGRRVRVRGWLEGQRHAHIVLADPRLIEVLDPPAAETSPSEQK